jgi:CrcB protein
MSRTRALGRLEPVALVAGGGFLGANLRHFLGLLVPGLGGTLLANALGSFGLGVLLYGAIHAGALSERARLFAATGLLSSFTTYSTFVVETALTPEWAVANVAGSYALGFAGVLLGREITHALAGRDD